MREPKSSDSDVGINIMYRISAATLAIIILLAGCTTGSKWKKYEVCFGMSAEGGSTEISDTEWEQFRDEQLLPRFPYGFTLYNAEGYWYSGTNTHSEPTMVLMIVSDEQTATSARLDAVISAYKDLFNQEAFLQVTSPVDVDFNK